MRKKIFITVVIIYTIFCGTLSAQLPGMSTASDPIWYYIQVIGTGTARDRVATVVDDRVEGRPVSIENINETNKQLWRFELDSIETASGKIKGYAIINKATRQRLSVAYNVDRNFRIATIGGNTPMLWRFFSSGNGYTIRMAFEIQEGVAGDIYLYQATATMNYALIIAGSAVGTTPNVQFKFLKTDKPVTSTEDDILWMYIKNAKTEKYLMDAVSTAQNQAYFSIDALKTGEDLRRQQWKLVTMPNGRLNFVNRATGNVIYSNTIFDIYYYLQYTNDPMAGDGWELMALGDTQFTVYTTSPEGVVKYWYATTPDLSTDEYENGNTLNTPFAWQFYWAEEEHPTSIKQVVSKDENIYVYSYDGRIYVTEGYDYKITTLYGISVSRSENLPTGIYLVTVQGKTTKIFVK